MCWSRAGRQSNTADLNLAAAGLTPGKRGLVQVDAQGRTEVRHIFAAGDVIGAPALAATGNGTGTTGGVCRVRYPAEEASGADSADRHLYNSGGKYGWGDEESLKKNNIPYVVGRARYVDNPRGQIMGTKVVF